jgi:hypothetical protein
MFAFKITAQFRLSPFYLKAGAHWFAFFECPDWRAGTNGTFSDILRASARKLPVFPPGALDLSGDRVRGLPSKAGAAALVLHDDLFQVGLQLWIDRESAFEIAQEERGLLLHPGAGICGPGSSWVSELQ